MFRNAVESEINRIRKIEGITVDIEVVGNIEIERNIRVKEIEDYSIETALTLFDSESSS